MSHGAVSTNADGTVLALRARIQNTRWIYVPPPGTTVQALTEADAPERVIAEPHAPNSTPLDPPIHTLPPTPPRDGERWRDREHVTSPSPDRRRSRPVAEVPPNEQSPTAPSVAGDRGRERDFLTSPTPQRLRQPASDSPANGDEPAHRAVLSTTKQIRQPKFQAGDGSADVVMLLTNSS